jgi:hypothetical protein
MFTTNIVPLAPISVDTPPQSKSIVNSIQAVVSTLSLTPKPQVKHALKPGANTLLLHFKSALLEAEALEEKYGKVRAGSCNLGLPNRVYVRKAQFGWRWDWGESDPHRPLFLILGLL